MNNEQLREEFKKWYISAWSQNGGLSEQEVADWWLNKMEEALSHQRVESGKHHGEFIKASYEAHVSEEMEKKVFVQHMKSLYEALLSNPQI